MNELSSMSPAAHHSALFLIQSGITFVFSFFKIELELIWKSDLETTKFSKFLEFLPVKRYIAQVHLCMCDKFSLSLKFKFDQRFVTFLSIDKEASWISSIKLQRNYVS